MTANGQITIDAVVTKQSNNGIVVVHRFAAPERDAGLRVDVETALGVEAGNLMGVAATGLRWDRVNAFARWSGEDEGVVGVLPHAEAALVDETVVVAT